MKKGNIAFSWEAEPGISKRKLNTDHRSPTKTEKLTPPPCPLRNTRRVSLQDMMIPLPPCPFPATPQPPSRTSSKKEHDPFMAAYRECTKSGGTLGKSEDTRIVRKNRIFSLSCKRSQSCSVMDGNLVRISHSE